MNEYHVCYELESDLCTGYNIIANTYIEALEKFRLSFKDKNILYVAKKK